MPRNCIQTYEMIPNTRCNNYKTNIKAARHKLLSFQILFPLSVEGGGFESPVGSSQRLKNWHLLLPWLAFTIKGLEQGWLAQCQFNVTGWGYHVYLRHGTSVCWHTKTQLESGPLTSDLTTTVVHSFKLLINDVKPDHSLIK